MAETSNPRAWRPGMTFVSPVTGNRTTDPSRVPGTPEYIARQNNASAARYTGNRSMIPTKTTTAPAPVAAPARVFGSAPRVDPAIAAAQAAESAARSAANSAARSGATSQRNALQGQIDAAQAQKKVNQGKLDALTGLVGTGLATGRDTSLRGINRELTTLLKQARANYAQQLGDVNTSLRDNEKTEADSSFGNLANRAREAQDIVALALANGAGESDILKAQLQSLRNWSSNQGEINRGYFDTMTSANSGLTDLEVGTRSNMTGYEMEANQRRGSVWGDFYQGQADAYTQMDTIAGNQYLLDLEIKSRGAEMSEQDRLLAHLAGGGNADSFQLQKTASVAGPGYDGGYAKKAAELAARTWENPGLSKETAAWKGQQAITAGLNSTDVRTAPAIAASATGRQRRPEGATLRKW